MVKLGALLAVVPVVSIKAVGRALVDHFPPPHEPLAAANIAAVARGLSAGRPSARAA
jgi:hypothetical protein